jgi:transposase-like protein
MRRNHGYSSDFKKSAVEKLLSRGIRTVTDVTKDLGISSPTIYQWRDEFAKVQDMKKPSSPQNRSLSEKNKSLFEYDSLPADKRGEYLRKSGIHEENLTEWRYQIEKALEPVKKSSQDRKELGVEKEKVKKLERELHRKDKALAEVSALLILKKKADLLWGSEEDE